MKKRFLILVTLGVLMTPSVVNAKNNYELSYTYDSNNGQIEVLQEDSIGSTIKIKVKNSSDMDIHDIRLYSSKNTRFVLSDSSIFVGDLGAGKERVISVKGYDWGSGSVQRFINEVGGLQSFIPLFIIGLSGVFFLVFLGKNKRVCYAQVAIAMTAGLVFVSSNLSNSVRDPNVSIELERHLQIKGEEIKWSGYLEFFEDTFSIEEVSEEEIIPYTTEYILDDKVKVTEDPVVEQEGRKGKRIKTYEVKYLNGEEISRDLVRDSVDITPQVEKIKQGSLSVVKKESMKPEKVFIPNDEMLLGEIELDTELTGLQDKTGESETAYYWNDKEKKVSKQVDIVKKPGKKYYQAGTLKLEETPLPAQNEYSPVENQEVGYEKIIKDKHDGYIKKYYRVEIDVKTGKEKKSSEEYFVKSEKEDPVNGKVEIGVLKKEEVNKGFETVEEPVEDKWTSYREVTQEGKDKIVLKKTILNLNKNTGICGESGKVEEEVIEEGQDEVVKVGSKEPNWVSLIELEKEIYYNTLFVPCEDGSLKGDEQKVITQGENGRIYSEYLVACDEEGNELEGYEKKLVSKDEIQDPIDEVIMVASDSIALETPQAAEIKDELVTGSLTESDVTEAEKMTAIALLCLALGMALRLLPRRRFKSVIAAQEKKELGGAEISSVVEKVTLTDSEANEGGDTNE